MSHHPKYINKQLLATNSDLYLILALYLINTIHKNKALTDAL